MGMTAFWSQYSQNEDRATPAHGEKLAFDNLRIIKDVYFESDTFGGEFDMKPIRDYNVIKYIDSIIGGSQMVLEGILGSYSECKRYLLNDSAADYISYIDNEPFYIPPSFSDVKTDKKLSTLKPKFV